MAARRELFVNSVRTVPIDGLHVTPTAIRYEGKNHLIGHDALDVERDDSAPIDNFKIGLGSGEHAQLTAQMVPVSSSHKRSIVGIAQDFMMTALSGVDSWAEHHSIAPPKHILVAEPLALEDTTVPGESWIANYRKNIRRILHRFDEVDFLPEPFAVFQYYRYGVRHPLIIEKRKHIALVLDFGGGTFDVSVLETTAQGDISQSGRNQKPLASKSIAVAGFYINRKIAEFLLFKSSPDMKRNPVVRSSLELYDKKRWSRGDPTIKTEVYAFFKNFERLVQSVEKAKIAICSSIINWDLGANLSAKVPVRVRVPSRPFSEGGDYVEITLDAGELREIFEKDIWTNKLKAAIVDVIRRAASELDGNQISVVLLSGGSSNIGWLRKLIERDLAGDLGHAHTLELSENFQEIVSKGLAIECARRYYTEGEGDFQAVLYNKLCLLLAPNDRGVELRRFRPVAPSNLIESGEDAVLLPSASSLRSNFDRELRWKVKLSATPSQKLEYHFMRSSFDPDDLEGKLNIIQKSLGTPKGASFGQAIEVSLTVREDGTATPTFIYGKGNAANEVTVEGMPFFLDMTSATGIANVDAYIGFDFGSSTSSFSLVSRAEVSVYKERAQNPAWQELSDLVSELPYPVAAQLARYLGEAHAESLFKRGRAVIEAGLTFLAYTNYSLYRTGMGRQNSALFKNLRNRSAGPLWALFRETLQKIPADRRAALPSAKLLTEPYFTNLNRAVDEIAKEKHDKVANIEFNIVLKPLCNVIVDSLRGSLFGYFEETRQRPFSGSFDGIFRNLAGPSEPFVSLWDYQGNQALSKNQVFLVSVDEKTAIDLTPLYVWGINGLAGDGRPSDLYMYDSVKQDDYVYNAIQERSEAVVNERGVLAPLWSMTNECKVGDKAMLAIPDVALSKRQS